MNLLELRVPYIYRVLIALSLSVAISVNLLAFRFSNVDPHNLLAEIISLFTSGLQE